MTAEEMQPGCAPQRLKSSSRPRSVRFWRRSSRSTTGTSRKPRAHCRCRAVTCTRRSSATGWHGKEERSGREREGPQRARLGSRDARGGQTPRQAARRRSDARPGGRGGTDGSENLSAACGPPRRPGRLRRAAHDVDPGRTWASTGRGNAGVAVQPRVRPQVDLLHARRGHRGRGGSVDRRLVMETAHGPRPLAVARPRDLGSRARGGRRVAAHRLRQPFGNLVLPGAQVSLETFKNFIAGEWVAPSTGEYFENRNPADWNDVIGRFPRSGPADMLKAIESAKRGFALWSKTPAPIRGQVLQRVGDLLVARKDAIARAMTREMGKVLAETRGDVQEGIDTAFYAATEGRRLFGRTVPSELRNKWAMSYRRPIGVAGLITPFNFPLAIPTWKAFPALLCGNALILKPSEDVPHTSTVFVASLLEAGLPPEVIQLVHGLGEEAGKALVEHR